MAVSIEPNQYTVKKSVSCVGVGLHSGKTVHLTIHPATANTGIQFVRTDLAGKPVIPARVDKVVDTRLATTIGDKEKHISTTEHLMAALRACGIDNALIAIDGEETPIMDGSAGPFVRLLQSAGRRRQKALRRILRVTRPVSYVEGDKSIRIEPYAGFKVTGHIHFDDELIKDQRYSLEVTRERFTREIATARTFGFVEQVEQLWQHGLALGGTLDNVIAIHWNRRSILNEGGLRFTDEFVRHKVLDVIGDMALLGAPLMGHVIADRSGHSLHFQMMKTLLSQPQAWEYVTLEQEAATGRRLVVPAKAGKRFSPLYSPMDELLRTPQPVTL